MYAQAVRTPYRLRRGRRKQSGASEQCAKGCAFLDVPLDCIKYLKLGDPCCDSGGMFVQSAKFRQNHGSRRGALSIYSEKANPDAWKLAKSNMTIEPPNRLPPQWPWGLGLFY